MANLIFWALTFDFAGKFLLVIMALLVHRRVRKDHKIDKEVLKDMKWEGMTGILALIFLSIGYILHLTNIY